MSPGQVDVALESFLGKLPKLIGQDKARTRKSKCVYQYTSLATLMSMLAPNQFYVDTHSSNHNNRLKELWATSAPYMNDLREFHTGREVFASVLPSLGVSTNPVLRPLLDEISAAIDGSHGQEVFCSCFTDVADDLGQWRGYGDGGRGCVLGFELTALQAGVNGFGAWVLYGNAVTAKKRDVQNSVAKALLEGLISELQAIGADLTDPAFLATTRKQLETLLPSLFLFFKDDAFSAEKEYRIIYSETFSNRNEPMCFRNSGALAVPFVKLSLKNNAVLPLREVCLGPGASGKSNQEAVRQMLDLCGLTKVKLGISSIPFVSR